MSVWGKLAGAAAGLAVGGPIGALLGGVAGHYVIDRDQVKDGEEGGDQVAFTVGVIALGAKMAKADGVVTMDEVNAFKEVFKVPEGEMKNVARVFNLAKQDVSGYEAYAEQLATMFKGNRKLLEDVIDGLFHIAKADDQLHPGEEEFLAQVANRFGFTETEFSYIKARHVVAAKRNPYDVLGVEPAIGNDELKAHYRSLIAESHPDKLIARGVPEEFVSIATEKVATINEAYEAIAKERGL
ncbi:TerB family tellurite resistance protein [Methyloceanibacter sp.]|uniref:TerB family tellurite resistance protein n=1 Tax=Methyloceanibacter sp. TaxID=1965321 RepID=UPI003569CE0C